MATYTPVLTYTFRDTLGNTDPNKVIKGAYLDGEFSAIHTASLDAASLAGNNSFLGNNTFATTTTVTGDVTATGTVKASGGTFAGVGASSVALIAASNTAAVYFVDASQPTDSKFWPVFTNSSNFVIGATNDADTVTRAAFSATRTGNAISAIALGNTTDKPPITLNGATTVLAGGGGSLNIGANTDTTNQVAFNSIGAGGTTQLILNCSGLEALSLVNNQSGAPVVGVPTGSIGIGSVSSQKFTFGTLGGIRAIGPVAAALVDMTPDTATGTVQCTVGMTTTPSVTATFRRVGAMAFMEIPAITGTATGSPTFFTITVAFPAGFTPSTNRAMPMYVTNSGQPQAGFMTFGATGIALFQAPITVFSGTCGFNLPVIVPYPID